MPSQEFSARRGSIWERTTFEGKSLPELRAEMDAAVVSELRHYDNVTWAPGSAGTISGKWVRPAAATGDLLYYIHGGGFTLGSSGIPLPFLMELSHRLRITCFSADYRLAPEHTFPAAPQDAFAGYRALLDLGYSPTGLWSAGNLPAPPFSGDPYQAKAAGIPMPKAIIAMSLVTDAVTPAEGTVLEGLDDSDQVLNVYAPGADKSDPLISPAFGDLSGYPRSFSAPAAPRCC